ncbi:MAG: biotin synthase BioB [bacterium]|nr:biotin synthase BioB [bacterium]
MNRTKIVENALNGIGCSQKEAIWLLNNCSLEELKTGADKIREQFFGKKIKFCAIVNARSGACSEDCKFCAQSVHYNTGVETYPLLSSELITTRAKDSVRYRSKHFGIVTSGPSVNEAELNEICDGVEQIYKTTNIKPCASVGKLSSKQLERLKASGLECIHHNLETSKNFFPEICSTHSWEEKIETIKSAKKIGLKVCSGALFGLGEEWEDRIDLAFSLREIEPNTVPINFLMHIKGTPMESTPKINSEDALKIIALYRHILPKTSIKICGGRVSVLGNRQAEIFHAGADSIMTGDYLTMPGSASGDDISMVENLGFRID